MRLLLVLLLTLPLQGAQFIPADESKALFRRDQLPIDTDTMRGLAAQLTTLAERAADKSAAQWRATAQLLAVAVRLDPANRPARELGRKLVEGAAINRPDAHRLHEAKGECWHLVDWLLQPDAGPEGQLLGHQLLDALRIVDPAHPSAKRHDAAGEATRWQGIVPAVAAFGNAPTPAPPAPTPTPTPTPPEDPPPAPAPPVTRPPVQLRATSLKTPLYVYDKEYRQQLKVVTVAMAVSPGREEEELTFSLAPVFESPLLTAARERVRASLAQTWPHLPVGEAALLDTGGERHASRNATALSGPASLLLHAALAGKPLRGDVVFLADLKTDGSLTRPRNSWDYLRLLRGEAGGRLLVSPDLQPELRSFLVLQDPGFFLKWEVLVVSSMDAALSLAGEGGDPEGLSAASTLFASVQELGKTKDPGQLSVNSHVRTRLGEVQQKAPFHLSASMMLLQGSSKRPTRLEREVVARILRSAIEPLASLTRSETESLSADRLDAVFATVRKSLDPLERYLAKGDLALYQEAVAVANLVRTLSRTQRVARTSSEASRERAAQQLEAAHNSLKTRFSAFTRTLAPYTGEVFPDPGPKREGSAG